MSNIVNLDYSQITVGLKKLFKHFGYTEGDLIQWSIKKVDIKEKTITISFQKI